METIQEAATFFEQGCLVFLINCFGRVKKIFLFSCFTELAFVDVRKLTHAEQSAGPGYLGYDFCKKLEFISKIQKNELSCKPIG